MTFMHRFSIPKDKTCRVKVSDLKDKIRSKKSCMCESVSLMVGRSDIMKERIWFVVQVPCIIND